MAPTYSKVFQKMTTLLANWVFQVGHLAFMHVLSPSYLHLLEFLVQVMVVVSKLWCTQFMPKLKVHIVPKVTKLKIHVLFKTLFLVYLHKQSKL